MTTSSVLPTPWRPAFVRHSVPIMMDGSHPSSESDPSMFGSRASQLLTLGYQALEPSGDDCDALTHGVAPPCSRSPVDHVPLSAEPLCSQPTLSRLESSATWSMRHRMAASMTDIDCRSDPTPLRRSPDSRRWCGVASAGAGIRHRYPRHRHNRIRPNHPPERRSGRGEFRRRAPRGAEVLTTDQNVINTV